MKGKLSVAARAPEMKLLYKAPGSDNYYEITDVTNSVTWSGSTRAVSRTLELSVVVSRDEDNLYFTPREGGALIMYLNDAEYFRGVIRTVSTTANGLASVFASDSNWYLVKNSGSFVFKNKTAGQIIKEICRHFGVKVGRIADTKFVFKRRTWLNKNVAEIFQSVIYDTYLESNRRFAIVSNKGVLEVVAVEKQKIQILAGRGTNLIDASTSVTIDNMSTRVVLSGGNDEFRAAKKGLRTSLSDPEAVKKYGIMTHAEHRENVNRTGTLYTQANQLLRQLTKPAMSADVTIAGDISVRAGRVLWTDDPITGLSGSFWVTADTHTFDANGNYTTQAVLSRTFEMEEVVYEEPDTSDPNKDVSTVGGMPTVPGIKINWHQQKYEATAYNPGLGGINGNGDGLVATGSKFVANRSLAVDPKVIPYGSVVYIKSGKYPDANGIYLAEDTGGAIKGRRLDLGLAKTKCKVFGRHDVQIAILERGTGPADARAKAKNWAATKKKWLIKMQPKPYRPGAIKDGDLSRVRVQVLNFAKSKVGKLRYKLGGGNPLLSGTNIGDCSDFTQWCFKQVGINTPNYSGDLWAKYQRVERGRERPGDVAVFAGTIPGRGQGAPSHVGIVTADNKMVNLQSYGCKEEAYRTGYWGKYLIGFVRVIND